MQQVCDIHGAATVEEAYKIKKIVEELEHKLGENYFKFINTGTINRYMFLWGKIKTRYIKSSYLQPVVSKAEFLKSFPKRYADAKEKKIIVAGMTKRIEAFLDGNGEYIPGKSTIVIKKNTNADLKFILGILNSKLLTFIYKNTFRSLALQGGYLRFGARQLEKLPIPPDTKVLGPLVDKMLNLSKELQKLDSTFDKEKYLEKMVEIEKVDKKIDEIVYKLYGLTPEEIKIVEQNYGTKNN